MSENKKPPQDVLDQGEWNFSPLTGEKLNDICPNCWVKNQPYNCAYDICPGKKLLIRESLNLPR